jgi:hypothetical protein
VKQPENTFITSVHKHLPVDLYWMKNHNQYNGGIADVWYSGSRADLWVEYKFVVVPARDETVIDLVTPRGKKNTSDISALQQEWLSSRHREGRNVGVIIGSRLGGVWLPGLSWQSTLSTVAFKERLQSRAELALVLLGCVQ